jgi:hypothetical protein
LTVTINEFTLVSAYGAVFARSVKVILRILSDIHAPVYSLPRVAENVRRESKFAFEVVGGRLVSWSKVIVKVSPALIPTDDPSSVAVTDTMDGGK